MIFGGIKEAYKGSPWDFDLFKPAPKEVIRLVKLMIGSNKGPRENFSMRKENNSTNITSHKGQFSIVHNFLLRI
jgi:hypothetical protein